MVAIITGRGVGLERSSALVLGSRGQLGSAQFGRDGEGVYVNAGSGNLVITRQDEFLIGLGPNVSIDRTHNSQSVAGLTDGDNNDNWRMSPYRKVTGLSGTYGGAGTTVKRIGWDGSDTLYSWNAGENAYVATDGAGAYDKLTRSGAIWTWTDGDSQITESYDDNNGGRVTATFDPDGNSVSYAYNGSGQISRITSNNAAGTADDDYTDFSYSGTLLTQLVTAKGAGGSLTRVRYAYLADGTNRLSTVTVDLSPNDSAIGDGNTYITSYTYDGSSNRIASITQQDGSSISFSYVEFGPDFKVASFTQTVAAGVTRSTVFDYSVANRTTVIDPAGQKTILWYNGNNELTQISYPEDANTTPRVVQFGYDVSGDGDVTSVTVGPGNVLTYDYDTHGNRKLDRDSAGNSIARTFSAKNELLTETRYLVPDADGAGAGQPGTPLTTRYAYDGESHLRYIVSAEGYVTQYEYNTPGQQTAANEYIGNAYPIAGLAENVSIAESTLTAWVSALDKTGSRRTQTAYDYRGNVATVTSYSKLLSNGLFDTSSELSQSNYVYDQYGKLLNRTVTGSAGSEVFTYDGLGRATQATDFNGNVTRTTFLDATGQTVLTYANGLSEVSTYNKAGELIAHSESEAGGNLIDLTGWPGNPAAVPSGQATVAGWMNPVGYTDETQWAATTGPDGVQVVAMRAGQLDTSLEGGGNYTHEVTIDATKSYEFTYYFKLSDLNKHAIYFGLSSTAPATVETLDGADNSNPYFFTRWITDQSGTFTADKWYKVVAYVLPQGAANPATPLGGVYDNATGQKILDVTNFRWNAERPGNTVHSRFFDYYGTESLQYSTYFYQPEIRQVSTPALIGPETSTSLYRYDSLGRLRMTIDPTGRANYMLYDSVGRKVADIDSDGSVIEYRYDGSDNLTSTTRYVTRLSPAQLLSLAVFDVGNVAPGTSTTGSTLLTNGSFDTSGAYTTIATGRSNTDLPSWTKTNAETFEQVTAGQLGVTGTDGAFWLDLDSVPGSGIVPTGPNLVSNGSFDTSGTFTTISTGRSNTTLPNWAKTNAENFEQVTSGQMGVTATDGAFWLDLDSVAGGGVIPLGSNLLTNGSFDTSGAFTTTATGRSNTDLPGWIKANAETFEQVASGQMGVNGTDGAYWLDLESVAGTGYVPTGSNLLTNGSFDTSGAFTTISTGRSNTTLPGWTKANAETFEQVTSGQMGVTGSDGAYWLDLDSVASTGAYVPIGSNLVLNPSFETSAAGFTNQSWGRQSSTLPNWTKTNAEDFEQVLSSFYGVNATNGSYWLDLDSVQTGWAAVGSNLLTNGSFDTSGSGYTTISTGRTANNMPGWTNANSFLFEQVTSGQMGVTATNGSFWLDMDSVAGANPNLIVNGSFEQSAASYTTTGTGRLNDASMNIPGWVKTNALGYEQINSGVNGTNATDGAFYLDMDSTGAAGSNMDISQTVTGLTAGQAYTLKFDYANMAGFVGDEWDSSGALEVYWNGTLLASLGVQNAAMALKTYTVTATSTSGVVRFREVGIRDGIGALIDNVQLTSNASTNGGNMDISQTVSGLASGTILQIQFDHANRTTSGSGSFQLLWNGGVYATINSTGTTMQTKTYYVVTQGGTNTLRFRGTGTVDTNGASIDNVRLFAAEPTGGGNMDISQTIAGLTGGATMQLQFDHANRTTAASGSFEVYWNNALVATITDTGTTMQTKTYNVSAVAGNNVLRFKGIGTVDTAGASIDNVRLFATQLDPGGGNMDISQTVSGLTAGQVMQLQFDHANRTTGASGSFEVYWNGNLVATINSTGTTMVAKTYQFTAIAGTNTLRFKGTGTVDANGASIDNVRLFATTTPVGGGNMDISQTVSGLTAGQTMLLQFDHANRTTAASGSFEVYWNNALVATIADTGTTMQTKTYQVAAVAGNNTVRFKALGTVDANGASIDNVRLFATQVDPNGGNMDINQTIGGLAAGQVMQLQFDHANRTTAASGSFEVYWNGALVAAINSTGTTMLSKTYQVTAIAGNNTLRFKGTGTVDANGASIDNVRLFATTTSANGGNMDISQSVGGLTAGQIMQLQFNHANRTTAASGSFEVYWNNNLVATITDTGTAMQTKTFLVAAAAGSNVLRFKGIGTVDATGASIDNVRLFATTTTVSAASLGVKLANIRPLANANDAWTFQVYDAAQRLVQTIDGTGATTVNAYDGASRLVSTTSYANRLDAGTVAGLKATAINPNLWTNAADGTLWYKANLSVAGAGTIDGANAYQFTVLANNEWQAIYSGGLMAGAGATVTATVTLKAVGSVTMDSFGLYGGGGTQWGAVADSYATIVSGPGQLTYQDGGFFQVSGLSTTQATRLTITRTFRNAEWMGPYLYLNNTAAIAGQSTIVSAPILSTTAAAALLPTADAANDRVARNFYDKDGRLIGTLDGEGNFTETVYDKGGKKIRSIAYAAATTASLRAAGTFAQLRANAIQNGSANLWASPTDAAGWAGWGLQAPQAAGTIDGYNAFKLTVAQAGVGAVYNWTSGIAAGETTSLALSVMAVGAQTSITLGPAGYNGQWSWGADDYSTVQIVSGPGTAARITGAMWTISGLSTTEATRFIITKRAMGAQDEVPHVYIGYYTQQAGDALIVSNPVFSRGNPADIETNYVYDSRGMLRATVDGEGGLTRYRYTALGDVDQEIRGQKLAPADLPLAGLKFPSLPAAPGGTILQTISYTRDLYGKALTETVSLTGGTTTTTAYAYDVIGRLVATTTQSGGADPRTVSQRFDLRGRLIGELDGIGNASLPGSPTQAQIDQAYASYGIGHAYDAADRMISSTDARGARALYYYDTDGRLVFQVDPLGETAEYRYDALGRRTDTIVYAARIAAATLAGMTGGNVTAGVATTMAGLANAALDTASHLDFDVDGSVKQSSDPLANVTLFSYNAFGELVTDIVPRDGAATIQSSRSYDRRGLLKTEIVDSAAGGKAIATSYGYDAFGRAVALTNALNKVTSSTYDRKGRLASTTDAVNAVTSYAYDARDNLVAVTDALGKVTRNVYDKANRRIATIDALGGVTATTYDADGRVVATRAYFNTVNIAGLPLEVTESALALPATNAADHITRYAYDKDGQLRFTVDGLMHVVENVYDVVGNVIRTVAYDGTIATDGTGVYSASWIAGQVAGLAGAAGTRTARSVYDVANRLIYAVDALGQVTWIAYDAKGQIIKQVELAALYTTAGDQTLSAMDSWRTANAGANDRTTRAYYDRKGRLGYSIDALGFVTRFEYDKLGNIKKQSRFADAYSASDATTLANLDSNFASPPATVRVTLFNYDSAGRLEETIDPEGFSTRLVLDQLGQISSSTAAFGLGAASVTAYSYDDVGRVLTETRGYGAAEASVTAFVYDALGRMTQRTAASGSNDTSISKWEYDALGQVTKQTRGFGTGEIADTLIAYDSFGRVTATTDPRGSVVSRSYNVLDDLLSETEQLEAGTTDDQVTTYTYDSFGNAVKVRDARDSDSFAYFDKLGRVVRQVDAEKYVTDSTYTRGGKVATVKRWANAATGTFDEISMPANPVADTLHDATTIFTYNARDELTAVQDAAGYTESYGLNGFGDRISLVNKLGYTTNYTFDRRGLLLSETLPITTKNAGGATISVVNSYAYDARGNRTQMIEAAGAVEARTSNYAYDKLDRRTTTTYDVVTIVNDDMTSSNVTPTETVKYDRRGNVIETIDAGGARTLFWYDDLDRAIWQVSQSDKVTLQGTLSRTFFDGNGNITSTRVYGDLIALPADATGAVPAAFDANNYRLVSYGYDRANRRTTMTIAALRTGVFIGTAYNTTFSGDVTTTSYYDKTGNVFAEADGNGNGTWIWYDKLGRKTAQVDREYCLTAWTRDAEGNVLTETRYATQVGSFGYGPTPPSVGANAADRITTFTYDKNGRRLTEARSGVAYASIGGTGALTPGTATSTLIYTYNGLGEVLTKTEANNDFTGYTYDAIGRVTLETGQSFTDYQSASVTPRTAYAYDGLNNLKSTRIQMGAAANDTNDRITSYTYGAGGRLATITDASGFVHNYGYDAAGRTVRDSYTRLKADGVTGVTEAQVTRYDLAGRAIIQTSARFNGSAWVFTDPAGAAYDAIRMRYNAFGDMSGRGLTAGPGAAATYQEVFDYDEGGRLWRSTGGDGSIKILFYDRAGNTTLTLSSVGADLSGQTYAGAMASLTAGGGTTIANAVTTIGVFDRRGQQTQTREPGRQLSAATITEIVRAKAYNAFGEVTSETDARGYATSFTYNNMGRLLSKVSPQINFTAENGLVSNANPTEYYSYDLSGRMLSIDDANGNRITRQLLAGSGHGDAEALITKEFHPDTGVAETKYDVFGDARTSINEIGSTETRDYDKLGRLTTMFHPIRAAGTYGNATGGAVQLIDYYGYDGLGQRTQHWNSQLGSYFKETTDYDAQGRVVSTAGFGGDATSYVYAWDSTLTTAGLATFGGWLKTTTNSAYLTMTERQDYFGRTIDEIDFGGHNYDFTFDYGGRLIARSNSSGESVGFSYYGTGLISGQTGTQGVAGYEYDAAGNRTRETFSKGASYRDATAGYDAMGRMTSWSDAGAYGATPAAAAWEYDKAGNIRYVSSSYRAIDEQGNVAAAVTTQDYWYLYDAMNRFVLTKGALDGARGSGTIGIGNDGTQISYYADGSRRSALYGAFILGSRWAYMSGGGPWGGPGYEIIPDGSGQDGTWTSVTFNFQGLRREDYYYTADGFLAQTMKADSWTDAGLQPGQYDQSAPEVIYHDPPATGGTLATMNLDAMGRTIYYKDYGGFDGSFERLNIYYDNAGRELSEATVTLRRDTVGGQMQTYKTYITNTYANGLLSTVTQDTYKNGDIGNSSADSAVDDSRQTFSYSWWDGALQSTIGNDKDLSGSIDWTTTFYYDGSGHVSSVYIADGRPRTVSLVTDQNGMIVDRDENDSQSGGDPRTLRYYFANIQMGMTGNNGTDNMTYVAAIKERLAPLSTSLQNGAFRAGSKAASPFADFEQSYDAINAGSSAGTGSSYTVNEGDTLQSIAQNVWGDSLLWYLLAQANGLTGAEPLAAGMVLTIPNKVRNSHNNAATWRVYNPNEALGDTSPTSIKPPKKVGACGIIARVIATVIAVVVAKLIPIPVIGDVIGNIASQAFLIAVGQQEKINWKQVGIAAIAAFLTPPGTGNLIADVALNAAANIATQGVAIATGLQKKFDWAGVAGAAVGSFVSGQLSRGLKIPSLKPGNLSLGNLASNVGVAMVGGYFNAATQTAFNGRSFGDNLVAVLPGAVGSTLGNFVAAHLGPKPPAYDGDGNLDRGEQSDSYRDQQAAQAAAQKLAAAGQVTQGQEQGEPVVSPGLQRALDRAFPPIEFPPLDPIFTMDLMDLIALQNDKAALGLQASNTLQGVIERSSPRARANLHYDLVEDGTSLPPPPAGSTIRQIQAVGPYSGGPAIGDQTLSGFINEYAFFVQDGQERLSEFLRKNGQYFDGSDASVAAMSQRLTEETVGRTRMLEGNIVAFRATGDSGLIRVADNLEVERQRRWVNGEAEATARADAAAWDIVKYGILLPAAIGGAPVLAAEGATMFVGGSMVRGSAYMIAGGESGTRGVAEYFGGHRGLISTSINGLTGTGQGDSWGIGDYTTGAAEVLTLGDMVLNVGRWGVNRIRGPRTEPIVEPPAGGPAEGGAAQSNRLTYMGATPDKYSATGRAVVERMRSQGMIVGEGPLLRGNPNGLRLVNSDGSLTLIDGRVDMAHTVDAVSWWNSTGRFIGPRAPEVRRFMLNPNNYVLQASSANRSAGARLGQTYLPPVPPPPPRGH